MCIECSLRFAISITKYKYDTRGKQRGIVLFFQLLSYFLCWFASSLCVIHCNYPLTTTKGDRFASCKNVVSRSHPCLFLRLLLPTCGAWFGAHKKNPPGAAVVNVSLANTQRDLSSQNDKVLKELQLLWNWFWHRAVWLLIDTDHFRRYTLRLLRNLGIKRSCILITFLSHEELISPTLSFQSYSPRAQETFFQWLHLFEIYNFLYCWAVEEN